jgi:hypothetical protein
MTQLTLPAEPRLRRPAAPKAAPADGQLARLKARVRAAGRRLDLIDFGVTLWLTLWASCVSASVVLLTGH